MAKLTKTGVMFSLEISEGEKAPRGTPQQLKNLFSNPNFWRELDDDYYKDRLEEWNNETFYVDAEFYKPILDGITNNYTRSRLPNESVTEDAIWRAGRAIRRVGRISCVTKNPHGNEDQKKDGVIGKIRLVKITPAEKDNTSTAARWIDRLTKRVQNKKIIARGKGEDNLTFEVIKND